MRCTVIFYKQYFSFTGTIATISQMYCIILFHKTIKRSNEIWKEQMVCCVVFHNKTATDPECNLLAIHMYMIYTCFIAYPVSCFSEITASLFILFWIYFKQQQGIIQGILNSFEFEKGFIPWCNISKVIILKGVFSFQKAILYIKGNKTVS